jgi:8-oxo-dGTP pyrophosphatase MutT (NUDIX family)
MHNVNPFETKFRGRVITVNVEQVQLPSGETASYEIVHHPGGAAIVALDEQNQVCLLRQFRPAAPGWVWELPAGRLEPGEPPAETARRELIEEAGRTADSWSSLGSILSSPGVFAETIHLYLARQLHQTPLQHERHEVIEVHWRPFSQAVDMALNGELCDAKTIVGLLRAYQLCAAVRAQI